jgi:hypothetical protein
MHDIDRTQVDFAPEAGYEGEQWEPESWTGEDSVLSEAEEMQLASDLLGVSSEADLDQFLGDLIKSAAKGLGTIARSPVGRAIGGVLKSAAKKALPLAGGALGGFMGGPLGAKLGSGLASAAGRRLGLEAESMAPEDREFEGARQFVRFAANTVKNAAASPMAANPAAAAQAAATAAARQFLPGLVGPAAGAGAGAGAGATGRGQTGRWQRRRDGQIVLYGV